MKSAKIYDIIVNCHHLEERIREALADGSRLGVRLQYAIEPDLMGIGAALKRAQSFLKRETIVLMNGDIIADLDLEDVLAYHQEQQADATLVLRPQPGARSHGSLDTDGEISLSALIGEAPDEAGYLHPTGIRVLGPRVLDFIPNGQPCSLSETISKMVQAGCHIEGLSLIHI